MRIIRTDLMSKSHFSKSFEISRQRLDKLIADDKLPVECIDGIDYINIADREAIAVALRPIYYMH